MRKVKLSDYQAHILRKIAERSKMDDWFKVVDGNEVRERDINDLIDGVTAYDVETLDAEEVQVLCKTLIECNKIKRG